MKIVEYKEYLEGKHFQSVRTKTLKLSNGRCQRCGDLADDCHHVTYRSLKHEVPGVDVVAVCRPCHRFLSGFSTYDPAAEMPDEQPEQVDPMCKCGWIAERLTDDGEPICMDCLRQRYEPD